MKRVFIVLFVLVCLTGCNSKGEEVKCIINDKEAIFKLNNGMVSSYQLDGKNVSKSEIDEINGINFATSSSNDEGRKILNDYVSSLGGYCVNE